MSTATELDTRTPNPARAYDYLLGGKEAFACDRELVTRIAALYPPGVPGPRELAERNRVFLERAVSSAVHDNVTQVLDLGAGFPAPRPLHAVAREARTSARTCYVDIDDRVFSHGQAAVAGVPGVAFAKADLTRPGEVTADPDVRSVIDFHAPVVAVFGLTLHFLPATDARRVIEGWARWLRPRSRFAITVAHWSDEVLWERIRAVYGPAVLYNHSADDLAWIVGGLDILGGEVVTARGWGPEALEQSGPGKVLAVVARKP